MCLFAAARGELISVGCAVKTGGVPDGARVGGGEGEKGEKGEEDIRDCVVKPVFVLPSSSGGDFWFCDSESEDIVEFCLLFNL